MKNIFASTIFFIFVDELCNKHKRFGEMRAQVMCALQVLVPPALRQARGPLEATLRSDAAENFE